MCSCDMVSLHFSCGIVRCELPSVDAVELVPALYRVVRYIEPNDWKVGTCEGRRLVGALTCMEWGGNHTCRPEGEVASKTVVQAGVTITQLVDERILRDE